MNKIGKLLSWVLIVLAALIVVSVVIAVARFLVQNKVESGSRDLGLSYGVSTGLAGTGTNGAGVVGAMQRVAKNTMAEESAAYDSASVPTAAPTAPDSDERLIVKTAYLSVVVKDVREAIKSVSEYAVAQGGFVVSSNVSKQGVAPLGTVTVRVPSAKFTDGLTEVKNLGETISEQSHGQDVTEEYVDLDSQLRNLQAAEKQFLVILQKAVKIEDILAVQRELTNVRSNIERLQGRMKYLKQSADLSTITVNFSTDPEVLPAYEATPKWKPWGVIKEAARALLEFGKGLVNFLIWLVIFVPVWAIIAAVVWLVAKVVKRIRNKYGKDINLMK